MQTFRDKKNTEEIPSGKNIEYDPAALTPTLAGKIYSLGNIKSPDRLILSQLID
jgi:hypothetical protein